MFGSSINVSEMISEFVLEVLLEIKALNEAVLEAALFSRKQRVFLQREEAILCALLNCRLRYVVQVLVLQVAR